MALLSAGLLQRRGPEALRVDQANTDVTIARLAADTPTPSRVLIGIQDGVTDWQAARILRRAAQRLDNRRRRGTG